MTIEQLRAPRGLLGWSQSELAARAGLSLPTVKRLEGGFGPRVSDEARAKLRRAIGAAGTCDCESANRRRVSGRQSGVEVIDEASSASPRTLRRRK